MSRISEEQKNDTLYYANKKNISHFGHICNTRPEVDAVAECMIVIKLDLHRYDHAVSLAPKDAVRTTKALNKLLSKAQNHMQYSDILKEWEMASPWYSEAKIIKNEILDACRVILKDAGIGAKRIDKIVPLLTWHLQYDDELLPEPNQKLLDLIESF